MKKWELLIELRIKNKELRVEDLITLLLENRGHKTKKEIDEFLNPKLQKINLKSLGINENDLKKSVERIRSAIKKHEQIIVFGDYDVDGITGCAILWEALNDIRANVMPYIPHRIDEGYGLSKKGIDNVLIKYPDTKLIITVDNGIVANEAVDYANSLGIEVIITDHHVCSSKLPNAFAIVHSTKICGAGVGWIFAQEISNDKKSLILKSDEHLGLVALATITDVMPLTHFNRILIKYGLIELRKSKRPGLIELLKLSGIEQNNIGVYELGHVIGPRLNAMGRIEHAMDSLRFLCTNNLSRAKDLANKLHLTNKDRQQITFDSLVHAKNIVGQSSKKLIIISDKSYQPGLIGLISGRLTSEYYRPSIVISQGEEFCKGSARSIHGFNIIEFIRSFSDYLIDAGGHPMAAGFTIKLKDLKKLKSEMERKAEAEIKPSLLTESVKIDCELPIEFISEELFSKISELSPFGYGNSEPVFLAKKLVVKELRLVGADQKHLKVRLANIDKEMNGILFSYDKNLNLKIGNSVDVVYAVSLNEWKGYRNLELKIKDIRIN